MKKIITTLMFIALSTVSAKAVDFSVFSLTAGLATNESVFGASATEKNEDNAGALVSTKKESGVFTAGYTSQFIELGLGKHIAIGYEHTPDSVSTPTNTSRHGNAAGANNVSVDFNDVNTTYVKVNVPFLLAGLYVKAGTVETDLDIKEVMGSGSTYANKSTEGTMMALGVDKQIGESGFGIRVEGAYMELDSVTTDNGIASGTASNADGSTSRNEIKASNMEGLTGKLAITYTLGRNN